MPTYTYETIPPDSKARRKRFTVQQSIKEEALMTHPKTGEPVRRVLTGGLKVRLGKSKGRGAESGPDNCCPDCHTA